MISVLRNYFPALVLLAFTSLVFAAEPAPATPHHGIALHGEPKYAADFKNFDYVNPDAPKGGAIRQDALGTYDTLNPFTLKGLSAAGVDLTIETLMAGSMDEPSSQYGWVAESVTVAPDKSSVSYHLRPQAKFNDGTPITPEDVIFSFEILRDKGSPSYASYFKNIAKAEKTGTHDVTFTFGDTAIPELPMIIGRLPVLPKKYWQGKDFAATTLEPMPGSGPYKVSDVQQGRSITLTRVKDWWAKDLPINKGRFNYDTIQVDYYRDSTVSLEAFFAGRYDYRFENVAKNWALSYDTPAVKDGLIQRQVLKNDLPAGMQAFIMNVRRPVFQDRRVREAIGYAFDFEWSVKQYAYNAYKRSRSYFDNSDLAATGLPSPDELKLLEPWRGKVPDEVFTQAYNPPVTDGSGDIRANLHKAAELLRQAGWVMKNGVLTNAQGQPLKFEILETDPMFERWTQPFINNLNRLGVQATFRVIDTSQMQNRLNDFDYDMTVHVFAQQLSPGNEEYDYFGSRNANIKGSSNLVGVNDPAVDAMIDRLVHATTREELATAAHALDRLLQWQYYVVPQWHLGSYRIAYWDMFGQPKVAPKYGLEVTDGWWIDPAKAQKIRDAQSRNR